MTLPATRATEVWPLVAVALGGAVGALLRSAVGGVVPQAGGFPWPTFGVNASGCFALAVLPALGAVRRSRWLTAGLGPGLVGGYTTLSAYADETRALLADGSGGLAGAYAVGTVAACLFGVVAGTRLSAAAAQRSFRLDGGTE